MIDHPPISPSSLVNRQGMYVHPNSGGVGKETAARKARSQKVKINTDRRMSFFMLCIASVLSVMCCDNRLNRSCVADTHLGSCGNLSQVDSNR